jgi:hypothetical protein
LGGYRVLVERNIVAWPLRRKRLSAASCAETGEAWRMSQQDETPSAVIGRFEHLKNRNGTCLQV